MGGYFSLNDGTKEVGRAAQVDNFAASYYTSSMKREGDVRPRGADASMTAELGVLLRTPWLWAAALISTITFFLWRLTVVLAATPITPTAAQGASLGYPTNDLVPTAVVLADFSASIDGPSSALWSMSIAAIVIGALIVQRRYRNY